MPSTITAIEPQRRGSRFNVFLDGRFALSLDASLVAALRLEQEVDATALARLAAADEQRRALDAAFRLLAVRPRSAWELESRLRQKGYSSAAIAAARAHLDRFGLVDDAAFARYWVEQRQNFRPRGRAALRAELRAKRVPSDEIDAAVPAPEAEAEAAYRAGRARLARLTGLDRATFRQRLGGYLQRRGFGFAAATAAVTRLWAEAAPES
jgi:regulatory protein